MAENNSIESNFVTLKNRVMRNTFKVLFYVNGSEAAGVFGIYQNQSKTEAGKAARHENVMLKKQFRDRFFDFSVYLFTYYLLK
jgi:hypothetical protein